MVSQEIQDAIAAHNAGTFTQQFDYQVLIKIARHAAQGVKRPDLIWDENLAADAQKWVRLRFSALVPLI